MWISKQEYLGLHQTIEQLVSQNKVVSEILSRIVEQQRTISFDFLEEVPDGLVKWDTVQTEAGSKQMTVWFEINEGKTNGKVSA